MHIQFESIRIVRFRSFLNEAIFHFNEAGPGLYFLKGKNKTSSALGSNGSGKSSIVDSLMWCLYGKTVQGLKNPDVIPWIGKGTTEVEVTIHIDKEKHLIKRTINPNKLQIDDNEVGQEYVNKLIPIPFEIIPYTIIMGQRQPLFYDLTASEKLKLFSEVLNLDRCEARSVHAATLTSQLENEINSKETEIRFLEKEQERVLSDIDRSKKQSEGWEELRTFKLSNNDDIKKDLQKKIADVANERDNADLKLDRALTELKAIKPALDKLNAENRPLMTLTANLAKDHRQAINNLKQLEDTLAVIEDDHCPTCKQSLKSAKQRKELEDDLKNQIKQINPTKIKKELDAAIEKHNKVLIAIEAQEKAKNQFEIDADEARDVLDRLTPQITAWEAQTREIERYATQTLDEQNPHREQLTMLRKRRDQIKQQIEASQKTIVTKREYAERTKFWIKGFKDIRLLQVEEVLQELEITTNSFCEEFGLVGWQIKYDIERETKSGTIARGLNITVLSPSNKNAVKWESWSGGEAQRLRLIGTLALGNVLLNHIGVSTNLMIFDEPTESLSKEGVQDLVELLAQCAKDMKKSIILVDHHLIESSHFIQTVQVTKNKDGSMLAIV